MEQRNTILNFDECRAQDVGKGTEQQKERTCTLNFNVDNSQVANGREIYSTRPCVCFTASSDELLPSGFISQIHLHHDMGSTSDVSDIDFGHPPTTKRTTQGPTRSKSLQICHEPPRHGVNSSQSARRRSLHIPMRESPSCPSLAGSGIDIELVYLAPPQSPGTHSTDDLLLSSEVSSVRPTTVPKSSHVYKSSTLALEKLRPSHKPLPLRWPFQIFILCLIAGLFALLEYEVQSLPQPYYTPLFISEPGQIPDPNRLAVTGFIHPSSLPTMTIKRAAVKRTVHIAIPGPSPDPDPRMSQSAYPAPGSFSMYCGWGHLTRGVLHVTKTPYSP